VTQIDKRPAAIAKVVGLGRLSLLLLVSIVAIAAFWQVMYGVSLTSAIVVVVEIAVLLALAFACAWRWSR
jgi:heme A synthase